MPTIGYRRSIDPAIVFLVALGVAVSVALGVAGTVGSVGGSVGQVSRFGRFDRLRCGLLVVVFGLLSVACSGDDDGEEVINLGVEAVGKCLEFAEAPEATVKRLPVVLCNEPHTHEIFFVARVTDEAVYPGFEALEVIAQARCLGAFEEYVGISPFESELFASWLLPTLDTWERNDDREIICVVGEGNAARLPPDSVFQSNR